MKKVKSKKEIIFWVLPCLVLCFLALGRFAVAAIQTYELTSPIKGVTRTVTSFPVYIAQIVPFLLAFTAVAAVVMIVIGGIQYAASLGNEGMMSDAKDRIYWAIMGLLLALVAFLILRSINPDLVDFGYTIPPLSVTAQQQPSAVGCDSSLGIIACFASVLECTASCAGGTCIPNSPSCQ